MEIYPFYECAEEADKRIKAGATAYQQFNCAKCGVKQTMDTPNAFHKLGICQECGHETNIEADGCNYLLVLGKIP